MKTAEQKLAEYLAKLEADRDIMPLEDGFYVWFPPKGGGGFDAWLLRAIADRLDELNEPLNQELEAMRQCES
jgi:hypothetical protein